MRDGGWSFLELLVAVAIVGIALLVMLQQMSISYRETGSSFDRVFAYQKALAILAEVQSGVERGAIRDGESLELLDDQGVDNPVLSTLTEDGTPLTPDHPMSGNLSRDSSWLWWRSITVEPVPSSTLMRYVRIQVKVQQRGGKRVVAASIGAVISLSVESFPSTQVHDLYVIAAAEAPSLWRSVEGMRASLDAAIAELEVEAPGLKYRVHWIDKLGYGRNQRYLPTANTTSVASQAAPNAYWYPSALHTGERLFSPDLFSGRIETEPGVLNDYDATTNPVPHAVADRFNHCMRTPRARRVQSQRVAGGLESVENPPLQILLADMCGDPDRFRNAIFFNLHGEALPCPPLRNYSDAAKAPARLPGVRVVTHPERLWTPRDPDADGDHVDSSPLGFRVYAYKTEPGVGRSVLTEPITLQIMGVDLSQNVNGRNPLSETTLRIDCLEGGVDRGGELEEIYDYTPFGPAKRLVDKPEPRQMYYEVGYSTSPIGHTWIKLYNTPLVAPSVSGRGLDSAARLYGMEYVPSPVLDDDSFALDLSSIDSSGQPKNTARWRIEVPIAVFGAGFPGGVWSGIDTRLDIVTRIGADTTTGVMWPSPNEPSNRSETYAWWSTSHEFVPWTERFQFQGDPRHVPYGDAVKSGSGFANGYNWWFDDFSSPSYSVDPARWPCLDFGRLADGGTVGNVVDAPRFLQLWRVALQACGGIMTHGDGLLAGAVVLGGEISRSRVAPAFDPGTVQVHGDFFGEGSPILIDALTHAGSPSLMASSTSPAAPGGGSITAPGVSPTSERRGRTLVVDGLSSFWAKPWLGELAPDSSTTWLTSGNLETPRFHHVLREHASLSDLPAGTSFAYPSGSHAGVGGGLSLLQSTAATGGPFEQVLQTANAHGVFGSSALELLQATGIDPDPEAEWILPITLGNTPSALVPHWAYATVYPPNFLTEMEQLVSVETLAGGSVISLGAQTGDTAYFSILGALPEQPSQFDEVLEQTLVMGLHALHVTGETAHAEGVDPLPQITVLTPTPDEKLANPGSVLVRWRARYTRYDGEPYTPNYASGYTGNEAVLGYVVMYSADDGETWRYATDSAIAQPGGWLSPASSYWQPDAGFGDESFAMVTPALNFPSGDYLIRVECHHATRRTHYAQHQQAVRIQR